MPVLVPPPIASIEPDIFDENDDGWQDMPVIREGDEFANGLDEEDQKRYHYVPSARKDASGAGGNATGNLLDVDYQGNEWRSKVDQNESEYTRLRVNEENESDEVHLRTKYLFDEDKAMTPLSQMQATKDLLTEAQRVAYVGLCALTSREMSGRLKALNRKEVKKAIDDMELWILKIMGRLYYHMELSTQEQKMIDSLAVHGIEAKDLVPALMTTHTVANPEYDPVEAQRQAEQKQVSDAAQIDELDSADISESSAHPSTPTPKVDTMPTSAPKPQQTTTRVLEDTSSSVPGVSTHLSAADQNVTLDIRWTVLCDLFLVLIADSVYDARSRVLLENVALKLGLGWLDVVKFERRVTEALEIEESIETLEQGDVIKGVQKNTKKRRYMMLGLATIGGGLVIGLSAGLLAPVIGLGLGGALATIGISGTTGFLVGTAGTAVITTGGILTGSGVAVRGMAKRTRYVRTFDILPLHNNKRVNCILTVPGFITGPQDDVRLPFSVLDPVVGDVFSVLWEPEMIRETGSALKILTSEVLTQLAQTALQATVMTALMSALQWPIILTKLGYLIDNPWSNALDRAKSAGLVLADVLLNRHLGVRPITLIGFSLGARVIFYALLELAKHKAFGVVQDVFLMGATVTAPLRTWLEVRSVISGRFVNAYARNDWVLNYLFRATGGGLNTVAGLRPIQNVPGLENVDVTDKIAGHMSYRTFLPLILDQLGFPVSADFFDEPVEPDFTEDRIVVREGEEDDKKKSWFSRRKKKAVSETHVSRPPSSTSISVQKTPSSTRVSVADDDLPPREASQSTLSHQPAPALSTESIATPTDNVLEEGDVASSNIPAHAGFDFVAIKGVINKSDTKTDLRIPTSIRMPVQDSHQSNQRPGSVPLPSPDSPEQTPTIRSSLDTRREGREEPEAGPSSSVHRDSIPRFRSINDTFEGDDLASDVRGLHRTPKEPPSTSFFGSADSSVWPGRGSTSTPLANVFNINTRSVAQEATASTLNFDSSLKPPLESTAFDPYALPSTSQNPFLSATSEAPLSFGGADGSITHSHTPLSTERDPWNLRGRTFDGEGGKKSASPLDMNPWQS